MTLVEFGTVMVFLEASVGKEMSRDQVRVYFDLLGDLPLAVLQMAVRQIVLEATYPTIPTVGSLRQTALRLMNPDVPCAIQAWEQVRNAINRYGYAQEGRALATLPAPVAEAARCLGWRSLCDSTEPEICRAQFTKAYDALAARSQREALLPLAYRQQLPGLISSLPPKVEDNRSGRQILKIAGLLGGAL